MGYSGRQGRQVVLTGGGAELSGLADYAQAALGKPVRVGRPPHLKGLPEAHAVPGFATLAGLILYAAEDPLDIRRIGSNHTLTTKSAGVALALRVWRAMRAYF